MPQKMTKLCILGSDTSIESSLKSLNISKSRIKKADIPKTFLEKKVENHQEVEIPLNLINHGLICPTYQGPKVELLFEDKNVLVLNKPPNIHCKPLTYNEENNILSFLRQNLYFKRTNFCFEHQYEGGLLYRLDFETSGVLFFSKDKNEYLFIRKNFKNLAKTKEYICIVGGKFAGSGCYKHFLSAHGPKKGQVKVKEHGELGLGIIDIKILDYDRNKNLTLLKVKLYSGIRHQIRVQLSYLGHPILGDILYGGTESSRLFLHAYKYEILIGNKNYGIECKDAVLFDRFFNLDCIF